MIIHCFISPDACLKALMIRNTSGWDHNQLEYDCVLTIVQFILGSDGVVSGNNRKLFNQDDSSNLEF